MGTASWVLGEYQQAEVYFKRAMLEFEKEDDQYLIGYTSNNIARIFQSLGLFSDALKWFEKALKIAKSFDITELGYLGADIVLDRDRGPLILELNARPGLSIQIANGHGLGRRLRYIDSVNKKRRNIDEKLALVKEKFADFK